MDSAVKAVVNIFITFLAVLLLINCVVFHITYNKATDTLYSVVQDIEIYGNNSSRINKYAESGNYEINVVPISTSYGFRYLVEVRYAYTFFFANFRKTISLSASTRMFER